MDLSKIEESIRTIDDFPKTGIHFKDITTAIKNPDVFHEIIAKMAQKFQEEKIDVVVAIEARGFIFGAALAYELKCGFVPVRKPGKLPAECFSQEYALEYGTDTLEIHKDSILPKQRVLIIDDLLATGGTIKAAAKLISRMKANIVAFAFFIEIDKLGGRQELEVIAPVYSVITCSD